MTRRDTILVLATLVVAIGLSAILFVGAAATAPAEPAARPRVFFDPRGSLPPGRTISDAQARVPQPFTVIIPLQRGVSESARDAAAFLLLLLVTTATLVLAQSQVVAAYRTMVGGWRAQARVLGTGVAVLGLGVSAVVLAVVVYLGFVAGTMPRVAFGIPMALQVGMTVLAVLAVFALLVIAVGFAAAAWRLGDLVFRIRWLSRYAAEVPTPLIAIIGATVLYLALQIPALDVVMLVAIAAYAIGAVVTARLAKEGSPA